MKKNKISKNWLNKRNKDIYFQKSKNQGYRARSAFKLIELNNKFNFLKKNTLLLDLGAFPGGWSQVASKEIKNGKILSIDLKKIEKIANVKFIQGDIMNNDIHKKIFDFFYNEKIDVVLSDMAVNTSGNKNLDSFRTGELCLNAMNLAKNLLTENGVFLSKFFMGSIIDEIDQNAKKYFKKVVKFKPLSSKKESKEIYLFCKGILKI